MISPFLGAVTWALRASCFVAPVLPLPVEVSDPYAVQAQGDEAGRQLGGQLGSPPMTLAVAGKLAAKLVELMRAGIATTEPNHSFFTSSDTGSGAPFDGSYDWHSSVIAHWALLVHARTAGDAELEAWVTGRLPVDVLARHGDLLERRSAAALQGKDGDRDLRRAMATFPYDEGWFLVLLAEVAKRPGREDVAALRGKVEARLLGALESRPFPENIGLSRRRKREGEERYCGFYGSSLMLYLQLSWAGPSSEEVKARLDAWRADVLEPKLSAIVGISEPHGYDFLWAPALLALADEVDGVDRKQPYEAPAFGAWPGSVKVATVHVLGMELCRVWPLARSAGADVATELAATAAGGAPAGPYTLRVNSLLARDELWATDFPACSHWVPQFLFIGEWLRNGRP